MHSSVLVALAALASGQWIQPRIFDQPNLRSGNARELATYFEFAPTSGAGLPVAEDLCSALAAEVPGWSTGTPSDVTVAWSDAAPYAQNDKVLHLGRAWICTNAGGCDELEVPGTSALWEQYGGNWCVGPDWLDVAGSQLDFAVSGSPATSTSTICPSGPDCTSKTALYQTATARPESETSTYKGSFHSDSWLSCSLSNTNWDLAVGPIRGKVLRGSYSASTVQSSVYQNGGSVYINVYSQAGASSLAVSAPITAANSLSLDCGFYEAIADGSSKITAYKDGVSGTTVATAPYPLRLLTATKTYLGVYYISGAYWNQGPMFGGFQIHMPGVTTAQASAKVAAIARRVLADQPKALVRGSPSLAMTYTRTGSRFCSRADNTGAILPPNRPCIAQNGLLVEAAATNLALMSQELDNASWSDTLGATTVTANYAIGPDGTKTAERLVFTASSAQRGQTITAADGTYTFSFYVKGTSGDGSISAYLEGGGTACAYTASAWTRCTRTTTTTGGTFVAAITNDPAADADDVIVWGAQVETGSVATSYIPTTSAAASRGEDVNEFSIEIAAPFSVAGTAVIPSASWPAFPSSVGVLVGLSSPTASGSARIFGWNTFAAVGGSIGNNTGSEYYLPATYANYRATLGGRSWMSYNPYTSRMDGSINGTYTISVGTTKVIARFTKMSVGNFPGGGQAFEARVSSVCLDPRPSRCR